VYVYYIWCCHTLFVLRICHLFSYFALLLLILRWLVPVSTLYWVAPLQSRDYGNVTRIVWWVIGHFMYRRKRCQLTGVALTAYPVSVAPTAISGNNESNAESKINMNR